MFPPTHPPDKQTLSLLFWHLSRWGLIGLLLRSILGFPDGSVVKNPLINAGGTEDTGSIPGPGRSPRGGKGNTLQYSCLENSMDREVWQATVHRVTKNQTECAKALKFVFFVSWAFVSRLFLKHFPKYICIVKKFQNKEISKDSKLCIGLPLRRDDY